jgi:DNA repair photolyase
LAKDKNQRLECGCVESVDIGAYNSCAHGCVYCYANYNQRIAVDNFKKHNRFSPLLTGKINDTDIVNERKAVTNKTVQKELF